MEEIKETNRPRFRKRAGLSKEQLLDPDFRVNQLKKFGNGKFSITCSKCHHCR